MNVGHICRCVLAIVLTAILQSCSVVGAVSPTHVMQFEAIGQVADEVFHLRGQLACVPDVVVYGELATQVTPLAYPRFVALPLGHSRVLAFETTGLCDQDRVDTSSIYMHGYVFEDASSPRWVRGLGRSEWTIDIRKVDSGLPSASREIVKAEARQLLRYPSLFSFHHRAYAINPYRRLLREDVILNPAQTDMFATDVGHPSCRRAQQVYLRDEALDVCLGHDPYFSLQPDTFPAGRCDALHPVIRPLRPTHGVDDANPIGEPLWRADLFDDQLRVEACSIIKTELQQFDLRQSNGSTFSVYETREGSGSFPLLLFDGSVETLDRAGLLVSEPGE